jgi:hypothetical protein
MHWPQFVTRTANGRSKDPRLLFAVCRALKRIKNHFEGLAQLVWKSASLVRSLRIEEDEGAVQLLEHGDVDRA